MTDINQTSDSGEQGTAASAGFGSIDSGVAGNYTVSVSDILSEAWQKTAGAKGTIWLAMLFYLLVMIPVMLVIDGVLKAVGLGHEDGATFMHRLLSHGVKEFLELLVAAPLGAGFSMLGIKLAAGVPVESSEVFQYFRQTVPLVIASVLMYLLIALGFCLLVLPGIYLAVAFSLVTQLVVEKGLSPGEALEISRRALHHGWFGILGLYLVMILIVLVSMIPLGIGLIWTMPTMAIAHGILYRTIFGYRGANPAMPVAPDGEPNAG